QKPKDSCESRSCDIVRPRRSPVSPRQVWRIRKEQSYDTLSFTRLVAILNFDFDAADKKDSAGFPRSDYFKCGGPRQHQLRYQMGKHWTSRWAIPDAYRHCC